MLSGFRTFQQTGIVLQVNANPEINIELALGELTETVSVEAATPLVETRSPGIGQVIENERIEELPLNGRNADRPDRAGGRRRAAAGAQRHEPQHAGRHGDRRRRRPGVRRRLPARRRHAQQPVRQPEPAAAVPGRAAGVPARDELDHRQQRHALGRVGERGDQVGHEPASTATCSSSSATTASTPPTRSTPSTRRPASAQGDGLSRNQYGGTFGGPLATDRLFFFGAYQGTRLRETPADLFAFVPTAAMLAGDFTQYASAACNTAGAVTLRAPFVDNRIDPSRFSPAALKIAEQLPDDHRPVRPRHLQPQPPAGRGAVHRQGRRAAEPEPLAVRPLHADHDQVDAAAAAAAREPPGVEPGRPRQQGALVHGRRHAGAEQQHGQRVPRRLQLHRHPPDARADRLLGARRRHQDLQLPRGLPAASASPAAASSSAAAPRARRGSRRRRIRSATT